MHAAPSVSYPVGRSAFAGALAGGLALLGGAAAAAWSLQAGAFGWRQGFAVGCVLAAGAGATLAWLRSPAGVLRWDGAAWQWQQGQGTSVGVVSVALDLQSRMLLRWSGDDGRALWLWVERTSDVSHWDALRRAVYSRASAPIPTFPQRGKERPPAGQPPAAEQ
jgi:hypothetical protein